MSAEKAKKKSQAKRTSAQQGESAKRASAKAPAAKKASTGKKPAAAAKASAKSRSRKPGAQQSGAQKPGAKKSGGKTAAARTSGGKPAAAKKSDAKKSDAKQPATKKSKTKQAAAKQGAAKQAAAADTQASSGKSAPATAADAAAKPVPGKSTQAARTRATGKVISRQFMVELGQSIREAVAPYAKAVKGREIVSVATSGDPTFELDRIAEKALLTFLKRAKAPVAYYSEDSGYSTFSSQPPRHLLVVDPIDGTRAAKSGFEGCVVSLASTRVIERPTIRDLDSGCVVELLGDRTFYAERSGGVRIYEGGTLRKPKLSTNTDLETVTWSMTVPARPAELIFPTAARLIDLTSLKGGFFADNSTSFSLTRLLTNQLDACVDFASRFMRDIPEVVHDHFLNAGRGIVLGIAPYDFAAALLIAQEAGAVVTDAYGNGFDDVLLLDSSEANHQTIIAASNPELHATLLQFFQTRIRQYEELLKRRAAAAKG